MVERSHSGKAVGKGLVQRVKSTFFFLLSLQDRRHLETQSGNALGGCKVEITNYSVSRVGKVRSLATQRVFIFLQERLQGPSAFVMEKWRSSVAGSRDAGSLDFFVCVKSHNFKMLSNVKQNDMVQTKYACRPYLAPGYQFAISDMENLFYEFILPFSCVKSILAA